VCFSEGVFDVDNRTLVEALCRREPQRRHNVLFVVDAGVHAAWPSLLDDIHAYAAHHESQMRLAFAPLVLEGGEGSKNDANAAAELRSRINELGIDRQSFVVAVGGGALLDMVGYAAATAHRGVRLVRICTTVLAQADSGVGVKNAVNAFGKKNFVGTFAPPFAVINDARLLGTLPLRDKIAGMAEAVKVALVRDAPFFSWMVEHVRDLAAGEPAAMNALVRRSAELHLIHIATGGDPFEFGSARPLDFGHWAAHKLESLTAHEVRHGEAVAIGIALDSLYSVSSGLLPASALEPILSLLSGLGFRLWHPALERIGPSGQPAILEGLAEFREHLGGELTVTMLKRIGQGIEIHEIQPEKVSVAMEALRMRDQKR
jgi:3-dehydroquinate synthase